jgi:TetR/AcrR family transcriptional regulator, tetracycline repressor protein
MKQVRSPGQRAGLTQARVLEAAHELVADEGVAGLTMRALAGRLGVLPNALYSHVATKNALVDALLDDLLAQVAEPGADVEDPIDGLRTMMTSTFEVLVAHADLVGLYISRQGARGPNAQRLGEVMLRLLARLDVTGERAIDARRVLIVYTIGFAAFSPRGVADGPPLPAAKVAEDYAAGLDWLLTGIATRK